MYLLFIRHGDPDYTIDSLTEKGMREADLLSKRVAGWHVTDFFVSPLGRARKTAEIAMKNTGRTAEVCDWLQEFYYPVVDPVTGNKHIPWDWLPSFFTDQANAQLSDRDAWMHSPVMENGDIPRHFEEVCSGIDGILARYGYIRKNGIYETDGTHCQKGFLAKSTDTYKESYDDRTLVFFCHLGVTFAVLGHLLNISPVQLWQGFFIAPASLTVLSSEERVPGTAAFRVQVLGDTQHLHDGGEQPSASGYFTDVFKQ
ncbi:MAG TPA: histidine phosphatase family protein [Treponema sp.]|nr:histidine phosphatase family protein [Treponema sp.]